MPVKKINRRFMVAPMMEYTDRHCRYVMRMLSKHSVLYTEMVTVPAILRGDLDKLLGKDSSENPVVCQIGGSDPKDMALCAKPIEDFGYDEININVGCPSDRVQNGDFGVCLMKNPERVAECVAALKKGTKLPVSVKTRIGVDNEDSYPFLKKFTQCIVDAGVDQLTIHARKAWLKGLSPKENREVPPLDYNRVYQLKEDFPQLEMAINGGIKSFEEIEGHLHKLEGVMLGRHAYDNMYMLAQVDNLLYGENSETPSRARILEDFIPYFEEQTALGVKPHWLLRHVSNLFYHVPGARKIRGSLANCREASQGKKTLLELASYLREKGEVRRPLQQTL